MSNQDSPHATSHLRRILIGGVIAIVVVSFVFWSVAPGSENTNDAQLDGHIHPLSARVSGTITWVNPIVEDTHFVRAGTALARLDANDYEPTVDRLQGDIQSSVAQLNAAKLNVQIAEANSVSRLSVAKAAVEEAQAERDTAESQSIAADAALTQSRAVYQRAEDDRKRYYALFQSHEISKSEYDQRSTETATAEAQVRAAEANLSGARQRISSASQRVMERRSDVQAAQTVPEQIASAQANVQRMNGELRRTRATLKDAILNLGYTEIIAPVDGVIGRRQIEVGQRVAAGQLILTLTPPKEIWAVANFKETQLRRMKIGQAAKIHVDASGQDLSGVVESFSGTTGSKYALLPPENATGNFVKIVQRVPVRIHLSLPSDSRALLPGMSVEVKVDTHH